MNINTSQQKLSALLAKDIDSIISEQLEKTDQLLKQTGKSFILFGAGKLGRVALAGLRKAGIEPMAFTDNYPVLWGQRIDGVEILSPQEAKQRFGHAVLFVITVFTSTPVRHQLEELDVEFISFAELSWKYPQTLLPYYAMNLPYSIFEQAGQVKQAVDIWADDASRNEYLAQLTWRTSLDASVLPACTRPEEMYFQSELFSFLPSDTLVDCGAYDGDTIRELERQKIVYKHLIAIEPDPINFRNLEKYLSTLSDDLQNKISLRQNAVGSARQWVSFNATGTANTTIKAGTYSVESIPLDEMLKDKQPTYIKMDIEGGEYDALQGCRHTLEKHSPILAVCLYHNQEDLWRIPLLIQSMSDRYRLFLRRYSDDCWEQVCYAIPAERVSV